MKKLITPRDYLTKLRPTRESDIAVYDKLFVCLEPDGTYKWKIPNLLPEMIPVKLVSGVPYVGNKEISLDCLCTPLDEHRGLYEFIQEYLKTDMSKINAYLDTPDWDSVTRDILAIVNRHQDYLCRGENLDQLAYIMMRWQNLYYCVRTIYGWRDDTNIQQYGYGENNPKYEIEDIGEGENADLIYDAWCVGSDGFEYLPEDRKYYDYGHQLMNEDDFNSMKMVDTSDPYIALEHKKNKTMYDWYELLCDPRYKYSSLYDTKQDVDSSLFFTIGNEYGWNSDGYISKDEPSGNDSIDYGHFYCAKERLREDIRTELFEILDNPQVQDVQNRGRERNYELYEKHIKEKYEQDFKYSRLFAGDSSKTLKDPVPETVTTEDRVAFLKQSRAELNEWSKKHQAETGMRRQVGEYYPLSDFSNIWNMPDNAHISYVTEGIRVLKEIISSNEQLVKHINKKYGNGPNKVTFVRHARENAKHAPMLLAKLKKLLK